MRFRQQTDPASFVVVKNTEISDFRAEMSLKIPLPYSNK